MAFYFDVDFALTDDGRRTTTTDGRRTTTTDGRRSKRRTDDDDDDDDDDGRRRTTTDGFSISAVYPSKFGRTETLFLFPESSR